MKVINKNNSIVYKYAEHKFSDGVIVAIILYGISIVLLLFSIMISFLYFGEAPSFVAGIGLSSIFFNAASMANIILEIYLYKNFHSEIRNMLILQIILFSVWIFII